MAGGFDGIEVNTHLSHAASLPSLSKCDRSYKKGIHIDVDNLSKYLKNQRFLS